MFRSDQPKSADTTPESGEAECRVYHYHVRKTAGTSLNGAFWGLAGLDVRSFGQRISIQRDKLGFVRHDQGLIEQGNYLFASSHIPAYKLRLPDQTFTVTILRDPLRRIVSLYRYLLFIRDDRTAPQEEPYYQSIRRETAWLERNFDDFLTRVPKVHLLNQLSMFSSRFDVEEARDRILACSAICFTETFSTDLENLRKRLKLPLVELRERRFGPAIKISERQRERARDMLSEEYRLIEQVSQALDRSTRTYTHELSSGNR